MGIQTVAIVPANVDLELFSKQEVGHYRTYAGEVELTVRLIKELAVKDRETATKVHNAVAECKRILEHIEIIRRGQVDNLNAQVKSYNDAWRPLTKALEEFEKTGKRKILAFNQAEDERKAREALEAQRAQRAAQEAQEKALAKAEAAKTQKARDKALAEANVQGQALMEARLAEPVQTDGSFRTEHGTTTSRMKWVFTVDKPADVPRQYLVVDEKAIRAAVANGVRSIAGVSIYEEPTLAVRI